MKNFNKLIQQDRTYQKLEADIAGGYSPQLLTGLSASHKAHFIYSLTSNLEKTAIVITPDEFSAIEMVGNINAFLGYNGAAFFPARELTFYDAEGVSQDYEHIRLGIISRIIDGDLPIVVASIEAASLLTMPKNKFLDYKIVLKAGEEYSLEDIIIGLVRAGYTKESQVDGVSQFALRGGILDIYPSSATQPYRIEFWGDEIDTISSFEIFSQRRGENVKEIEINPVREAIIEDSGEFAQDLESRGKQLRGKYGALAKEHIDSTVEKLKNGIVLPSADRFLSILYGEKTTLFDYCNDRMMFVCEPVTIRENNKSFHFQHGEDIKILLEKGVLFKDISEFYLPINEFEQLMEVRTTVILDTFTRSIPDIKLAGMNSLNAMQLANWSGSYDILKEDIDSLVREGYKTIVMVGSPGGAEKLKDELLADGFKAKIGEDYSKLAKGEIYLSATSITSGIRYPDVGLALITQSRTLNPKKKRKKRYKDGKKIRDITDLNNGDYVVHSGHGIGVFKGIIKRSIQGVTKDYIKIQYAGTDALFIPVTQLDLVSKYIGATEGKVVKLNKLNSMEWQKTRARVKGAVKEMAKELIALYAKRQSTPGFAFSADTEWQSEFEQYFPYNETEDQLISIEEIKRDMEKTMPMDRLLCGDVGFGKTEVAVRAIFKCVMDSKQSAILVPTTILAWQHYQSFLARFKDFPIKIELLSRFRTPKQQKEILKQLKSGEVDVVVGTHRIVQKDIEFKDLGLCIIDEEQRFGVAHKERFKELRANIDVLTLSATPIPRTLNMAMSGIRDMSLIEDPPQDRHPVQTYVMEYDDGVILQAIQKELRRGGQVFYLHNNTHTIDRCADKLQKELPDANIEVAHGKMGEESMSDIWRRLIDKEIDILVCTTIIETGVDVSNANTLIIEDADNYGLSQLYQLRGRVGRSSRRAYAYLTFRKDKVLTEIASKRLEAIREFTAFGSGFQIAMRDLEIRGAGNILGAKQHGHMEAVGYDMYIKLLNEAVNEQTGKQTENKTECIIDIQVDAFIPERYISNTNQRIDIYKRISSIENNEDAIDVTDELIDRFGEPSKEVLGLIDIALVRGSASEIGISEIKQNNKNVILYPKHFDLDFAGTLTVAMGNRVLINAGERPYYSIKIDKDKSPLDAIKETITEINNIKSQRV